MDADLRLLRYFVAVAEELNFTRAAERLYISQPALSKQIRQLERELGIELLRRNSRDVKLTAAGAALLPLAQQLLQDWQFTLLAVREVAASQMQTLRVGFISSIGSELTKSILTRFQALRQGWKVTIRFFELSDPTAGLLSGNTDVALLRLPVPKQEKLSTEILLVEPRWVALSCDHPLAQREVLQMADLINEPFITVPAETGIWRDHWLATDERGGHPIIIGAEVNNTNEAMEAVINGQGVALVSESTTKAYTLSGQTFRPVKDVSPSVLAVAWRRDSLNSVVQDFVQACVEVSRPSS
ncbi:LysR substrate-binding domain-containing protein [Dendronalium sp. ChiSLP03b]|uniref:LysR substrate-binding domain-containing protein n=1 Tax=Dendronalium sp. ChiSLP03b TaxID=3075381 RepID=UPI002AD447C7|nr:LysR substrate-binding domain-containing protein [Dendronalium sp. ChiSLP03b]MDZ8206637.1 LysR substrate-binding domain-containing protein [Dendronalium sp. ChiSLP03b]